LFFVLFYEVVAAQQLLASLPIKLRTGGFMAADYSETMPVRTAEGKTVLFLMDKKEISAVLLNANFEREKEIKTNKPDSPVHKKMLGGLAQGDIVTLFYSDNRQDNFGVVTFDFATGQTSISELNHVLGKDLFIEAFEHKGKFYILSIPRKSNTINVYEYSSAQNNSVTTYDFSDFVKPSALYDRLLASVPPGGNGGKVAVDMQRVTADSEQNLNTTYVRNKLYVKENKIVLSLDSDTRTQLFTMDLDHKTPSYRSVRQPDLGAETTAGNSVVYNNRLFQVRASSDVLVLQVVDMDSGEVTASHKAERGDSIAFANTPVIQEGGATYSANTSRELSKTKQLLRKMINSNAAIAVNSLEGGNLVVTIGSYKEMTNAGGGGMMGGGAIVTPYGSIPAYYVAPVYYGVS
jgi:hypothetical protein